MKCYKINFNKKNDEEILHFKKNLYDNNEKDFDIIIDNEIHEEKKNLFSYLFDFINDDGYYIIENLNSYSFNELKNFIEKFYNFEVYSSNNSQNDLKCLIFKRLKLNIYELGQFIDMDEFNSINEDKIKEFYDFFEFDEFIINHKFNKVFSISLFDQNVNTNNPDDKNNKLKTKFLDNIQNLVKKIENKFPDFGIIFWIDEKFKDIDFGKKSNVYIFKNKIYGAIGTFWRFLSLDLDYVDDVYSCDLDLNSVDDFIRFRNTDNCTRILKKGNNDFYTTRIYFKNKNFPFMLAGLTKLCKKDLLDLGKIKTVISKFLYYQKYLAIREKYTIYGNTPKFYGFGNIYYKYGTDERFLSKVIYPYLVKNKKLTTFWRKTNNKEDIIDIEFCKKFDNDVIFI